MYTHRLPHCGAALNPPAAPPQATHAGATSFWVVAALLAATTATESPSSPFVKGAVCQGTTPNMTAPELLRGKHLVLIEADYGGINRFCNFNPTKKGKLRYSGFDIDIMNQLSEILGFTYEVKLMPPLNVTANPDGTWTQKLFEWVNMSDVVGEYWLGDPTRRNGAMFIYPHIDATRYLVASTPETVEPALIEIMTTFMEPFEGDLWLLIVATMFVFGTVIWYLEKDSK